MKKLILATFILGLVSISNCLIGQNINQDVNYKIFGSYTLYEQLQENKKIKINIASSDVTISEGHISAFVGCNRIGGAWNITGKNKIEPVQAVSTRMSCKDEINLIESNFNKNLSQINRFKLCGSKLCLYKDKELLIVLKRKLAMHK